jgi:thioredoxin-like negative regulator of GroEL
MERSVTHLMLDELAEAKAQFSAGDYDAALMRLQAISNRAPMETEPIAAMALCYYELGQTPHARRIWKIIVSRDARYLLPRFLRKELGWPDAMLAVARKVSEMVV